MDSLSAFANKEKRKEEAEQAVVDITSKNVSSEAVVNMYQHWAETYDQDMQTLGRATQTLVAEAVAKVVSDKDARILDVGAGTGLSGQALADLGYRNIDALDPVQEMLDKAKTKEVYTEYICAKMGKEKTHLPDNAYDAVACVGSFCRGHLTEECFPELIRIVKPGGYIIMTASSNFNESNVHGGVIEMAEKGLWTWKGNIFHPYGDNKFDKGMIYTITLT